MQITDIKENTPVILIDSKNGYKLNGIFVKYLPECVRYEFQIYIGGSPHSTRILFHKDTFKRYDVILGSDA